MLWTESPGPAPGRAVRAGGKCEFQRPSRLREPHNLSLMGMKKRKEGGNGDALTSNLEVKGHLGDGVVCSIAFWGTGRFEITNRVLESSSERPTVQGGTALPLSREGGGGQL